VGEEAPTYFDLNMFPVYWVEANPEVIDDLTRNVYRFPLNEVINTALWSNSGEILTIYISQDIYSSSVLKPSAILNVLQRAQTGEELKVESKTFDQLNLRFFKDGMLVLDIQGAESYVLQGSENTLKDAK
jgi:FkbM family methyltransferase